MTDTFRAMCAELDALLNDIASTHPNLSENGVRVVNDLSDRARTLLAQQPVSPPYKLPEPERPTDQEIARFLADRYRERMDNQSAFGCPDFDGSKAKAAQIADARAVLARWGRPAAAPVAEDVAELAEWLLLIAGSDNSYSHARLARAATLLSQQAAPAIAAELEGYQ